MAALLPSRCPGCGVRAEPVCRPCAAGMRCAPPSPPPTGIDSWAAAFSYEGVARELVARLKYRNARAGVPWLADVAAGVAQRCLCGPNGLAPPDVVTWPPTLAERRRVRGFDQAEILAGAVGRRLATAVRPLLGRLDRSPQTGRSAAARRAGPQFAPRGACYGLRVLVVDDVATTGSTLASCGSALRSAGAVSVVAVTIARTPPPGR